MTEYDDEDDYEPDPPECQAVDAFLTALARGDESAAAQALRTLVSLGGALDGIALEILAERFEGHPDPLYPWQLEFGRPGQKGRPPADQLRASARQCGLAWAVKSALESKPNMNVKAAAFQVSKKTGIGESTLKNAYYAYYPEEKKKKKSASSK